MWQHLIEEYGLHQIDPIALCRTAIDLVFVSVLLDAGAGSEWSYTEPVSGITLTRSEGLAAASLHFFFDQLAVRNDSGGFSISSENLKRVRKQDFSEAFQSRTDNLLLGIDGRVSLLNRLGALLDKSESLQRPNDFLYFLADESLNHEIDATEILNGLLMNFNSIWPNGLWVGDSCYGDAGFHPLVESIDDVGKIVPFHKLSQWLSYSIVEPLERAGVTITNLDGLTGLPEYRNGGLLLDSGVLRVKQPRILRQILPLDSEFVIEWRALTVSLLDEVAANVRRILKQSPSEMPLGQILQGGTWSAGRKIAFQKRGDYSSPIQLALDGTVF